jgi:uncharacterized protein with GYD domain
MPKYLIEARYTTEGVKGVAAKGGSARRDAVAQTFEASGGKLEAFYFAFGDVDAFVIGELPNNEAATAVAMTVNASGAVSAKTVVLLTPEEVDSAAQASVQYTAPGS